MLRLLSAVLLLALAPGLAQAAPNIYPDPSFEASGVVGASRTGERAAYLKVGPRAHWSAFGHGAVTVEPFARYRVTVWVKARLGKGGYSAPFCYSWDSYEWAFCSSRPAPATDEWKQSELTFVTPNSTMYVHPLAYIDAENCEGWADDIVVEKIAEPAQVMAEIAAKAKRTDDETRLLGRWLVAQGDLAGAAKLMEQATGLIRADLATVLARATQRRQECLHQRNRQRVDGRRGERNAGDWAFGGIGDLHPHHLAAGRAARQSPKSPASCLTGMALCSGVNPQVAGS